MSDLKISVDTKDLSAAFARAGNAGVDIPAALREIGGALRSATVDRFASETAPGGVKWRPLAAQTVKRKKSTKILVLRGALRNSINAQVSGTVLEVGSPVPYASIHQFGGVIDMPDRTQNIRLRKVKGTTKTGKSAMFTRFAKAKHKRAEDRTVEVGAHKIVIPARPFLDVRLVEDMPLVTEILDRRIRRALALPETGSPDGGAFA